MPPFFTDYLDRLHALQQDIEQTLEGLSQDAIQTTAKHNGEQSA